MLSISHTELLLGVDVGTTTLSLIVIDTRTDAIVYRLTLLNDSRLPQAQDRSLQDAQRIADLTLDAVASLRDAFPDICAIGVTGQMHGIVCLDEQGMALSPLYTWQSPLAGSHVCEEIFAKTGHRVYPGYGHATLYALARSGGLPDHARQYCTIMDYIVMRLTGRKTPLMHSTNAASLGVWDLHEGCFDEAALSSLNLSPLRTPKTVCSIRSAGFHDGVPVCVAVGDNQASFFGSVQDETHSLLLNYGTGSQLSFVCASPNTPGGEIRPYFGQQYLFCRSALCGGRAYAMLERFFAAFVSEAGFSGESQYETLNALCEQAYTEGRRLTVHTQFCGTRENPDLRGSILNIDEANFTPGALALGVVQGMVDELHSSFDPASHPQLCRLVASGNAVRKNPMLRRLLSETFSMPLLLTNHQEEAALGAALLGGIAGGIISYPQAKAMIRHEPK